MRRSQDLFDRAHKYVEHCRRHWADQPVRAAWNIGLWGFMHMFGSGKNTRKTASVSVPKVAFILDGGLGDTLVNAFFLRDFFLQCGPMQLDICTEYPQVFQAYLAGGDITARRISADPPDDDCDLILYCLLVPSVVHCNKTRVNHIGSPQLNAFVNDLETLQKKEPVWFNMQDHFMGAILAYGRLQGRTRAQLPYMAGSLEPTDMPMPTGPLPELKIPEFSDGRPFITVHRGSGSCITSTKLWSDSGYDALLTRLRHRFPGTPLVQVGHDNEILLDVDIDLRGRTSLTQLATLMRDASLHIASEGSTVHLRHILCRRPSVVFFGPTDPDFYGYAENLNIRFPYCRSCEWVTRDWQQSCARGFSSCRCLEKLTPEKVWQSMEQHAPLLEDLCSRAS